MSNECKVFPEIFCDSKTGIYSPSPLAGWAGTRLHYPGEHAPMKAAAIETPALMMRSNALMRPRTSAGTGNTSQSRTARRMEQIAAVLISAIQRPLTTCGGVERWAVKMAAEVNSQTLQPNRV